MLLCTLWIESELQHNWSHITMKHKKIHESWGFIQEEKSGYYHNYCVQCLCFWSQISKNNHSVYHQRSWIICISLRWQDVRHFFHKFKRKSTGEWWKDNQRNADDNNPITTIQMFLLTFQMLGNHRWERDVEGEKNYISNLINLIISPLNINKEVHLLHLAVISFRMSL